MRTKWIPLFCAGAVTLALGLPAQDSFARHGADDPPGHNLGDDRRGARGRGNGDAAKARVGLPVKVHIEAPERGHRVGIDGRGWIVDLEIEFDTPLASTGFTVNPNGTPGFQITGPGGHAGVPPFQGTFSAGADDRLPGLIVLLTTTTVGKGPCMNLANLFNLTGITDLKTDESEIWDTWIVGAPNFGVDTPSTLFVAVADDLDGNGIYDDAPLAVPEENGDGVCTQEDLMAFGVASNIEQVHFYINGPVDLFDLPVVP